MNTLIPFALGAGFAQGFEEPDVVAVVAEDHLAEIATIHHMVDRAGIFDE